MIDDSLHGRQYGFDQKLVSQEFQGQTERIKLGALVCTLPIDHVRKSPVALIQAVLPVPAIA
jgi:hypothetical protein